jgi:hypothetical protein
MVENSLDIFNGYMNKKKFHWSVKALANAHPETVQPTGEDYDLNIKPSNRSMEMLSSVLTFTKIEENLDAGDVQEIVAGLLGMTYAARHADIVDKGAERMPTGEEIITKYDDVRQFIVAANENARQDFINQVKENFVSAITDEDAVEKYQMRAKKEPNGEVIIPPSLDNVYKFFLDIPAEFRVELVKIFVENKNVHPVLAMHQKLYDLVKEDIARSNRKGKANLEKK